jgi:hypothetical protein
MLLEFLEEGGHQALLKLVPIHAVVSLMPL